MSQSTLSADNAGPIIGLTGQAIRDHVAAGRLPCQRVGVRRLYRIDIDDLKALADKYNYPWDQELVDQTRK